MLNSAEHEILNAQKYKKKYQEIQRFSGLYKFRMVLFLLINVNIAIFGILTFMSKEKLVLS